MTVACPNEHSYYRCTACEVYGKGDACWYCESADGLVYGVPSIVNPYSPAVELIAPVEVAA